MTKEPPEPPLTTRDNLHAFLFVLTVFGSPLLYAILRDNHDKKEAERRGR